MTHPLVEQLRFARSEFFRAFDGVSATDAERRILPMNSIGWIVGHLAWQEQRYFLSQAQGITIRPDLNKLVGYGRPASTPPLAEMIAAWREVTDASEAYVAGLTTEILASPWERDGKSFPMNAGTRLLRMLYHYWYHTGEILGIRQMLGHTNLPEYVGNIEKRAPYRPETEASARATRGG